MKYVLVQWKLISLCEYVLANILKCPGAKLCTFYMQNYLHKSITLVYIRQDKSVWTNFRKLVVNLIKCNSDRIHRVIIKVVVKSKKKQL